MNAIFVLWPAVEEFWEVIERGLNPEFRTVARQDVHINTQVGMRHLMGDVYGRKFDKLDPQTRARPFATWERKAKAMGDAPYTVRVVEALLVGGGNHGPVADKVKARIRQSLPGWTEKPDRVNLHASDGDAEAKYLAEILFSSVNIEHLNMRPSWPPRKQFLDRLNALRMWCRDKGIDAGDICIVSGGVLEACGIRQSSDLDIIMKGRGPEKDIAPGVDVAKPNYGGVANEELIDEPAHHFIMLGFKFAALRHVKAAKKRRGGVKDRRDLELIR